MLAKSVCILLSGRAGVGKSTSANYIKEGFTKLGYSTIIAPFAFGVKQTAKLFGWDEVKDDKGRKLLQAVGSAGRGYDPDIWVARTMNEYIPNQKKYPFDVVLIDDWRFPNEYDYVSKINLYSTIKIRIVAPEREILAGTDMYNDISECALTDNPSYYNYVVDNTDSMLLLHIKLDKIIIDVLENQISFA